MTDIEGQPQGGKCSIPACYAGFDQLATMVAVVRVDGAIIYVNSAFEDIYGVSGKTMRRLRVNELLSDPSVLSTLSAIARNRFSTSRFEDVMRRQQGGSDLPVQVIVSQTQRPDELIIEFVPVEQQARKDREERQIDQAQANKELIRNLAHEIKNPLGGIRGAAQLLQMEVDSRELIEYAQVIIHEADRLQALVDRLLAPHRKPHVVGDVNIHEVCERVRALIMAEFPKGMTILRDYDTSIPEFRGDKEQLIQAVLNIAHNAALALAERRASGDAVLELHTRISRQVTYGKRRHKLALELHIIDNGPGVPAAIKDRIFYPLVSGRDGGSGLGLTLAQTFVQQHQGLIECDSRPGHTDFTIYIPLSTESTETHQ